MMVRKDLGVAAMLGTFAACGALLASTTVSRAQSNSDYGPANPTNTYAGEAAAPGAGAFPGSFLVPGTNTSVKFGGFAKLAVIYDFSAPPSNTATVGEFSPDLMVPETIPLEGTATHSLHNAIDLTPRQSNFNFDVRTPTAYGELDTFILVDFFGRNNPSDVTSFQDRANPDTARLVLAYGTLGPLLAGQNTSLWFDGDATPETVDPTPTVGIMNGLSNRQPQVRYTYLAGSGLSFAASIEQPQAEIYSNTSEVPPEAAQLGSAVGATNTFSTNSLNGIDRAPDVVARARFDQAWGHVAATALYRNLEVVASGVPRIQKNAFGGELSGHLNTFGKDTLRGTFIYGQGLGHYISDFIEEGGLQATTVSGAVARVAVATSLGINAGYTHWWTDQIRSTVDGGYARLYSDTNIITTASALNGLDKYHIQGTANLLWSPVPQVDLGIEFDWAKRVTNSLNVATGAGDFGYANRLETMAAFKF